MFLLCGSVVLLFPGCDESARIKETRGILASLRGCVEEFRNDMGDYPTTELGWNALREHPLDPAAAANWKGPYLKRCRAIDAWGNPIKWELRGTTYELHSCGPDGEFGNQDDLIASSERGDAIPPE
jgi:general secretion pathway protein G